jgi:isopentenyl phosphate kinase
LEGTSRLFLVHGGGSFGHYYANKYGLSSRGFATVSAEGISATVLAMQRLNSIIVEALLKCGVNTRPLEISDLLEPRSPESRLTETGAEGVENCFAANLVPITFGNVGLGPGGKARVISGDSACLAFARSFPTERAVFGMDVDGIFRSPELKRGELIRELKPGVEVRTSLRRFDVTGGVHEKIALAFKLSTLGAEVFFVNGTKSERLARCLGGSGSVIGTRIRPSSGKLKKHTF